MSNLADRLQNRLGNAPAMFHTAGVFRTPSERPSNVDNQSTYDLAVNLRMAYVHACSAMGNPEPTRAASAHDVTTKLGRAIARAAR